jgi:hypothetical protein
MGMTGANIAFAQSPPGIGRKRPSLPGQPLGDPASGVPFGCRKCVPFASEEENPFVERAREASRNRPTTNVLRASRTTKPL